MAFFPRRPGPCAAAGPRAAGRSPAAASALPRRRSVRPPSAQVGPLLLLTVLLVGASARGGDWTEWRVREVRCMGLSHTDSTAILRELDLLPGVGYDDELLDADANAIKNTNLFARLVVSVKADSADESVDIVYAVTERPPWFAYPILTPVNAPDNKLDLVYGFGLMHRNLGGMGRRLDLEAEYGAHLNYSLAYMDPWFLGLHQPLSFHAARRINDNAERTYRSAVRSLSVGLSRYLDREISVGLSPWWQEVGIRDRRVDAKQVTVNPRGLDVYGGLTLSSSIDRTDVHVNPGRGWRTQGSLSGFGLGGGNQPAGHSLDLSLAGFVPLGRGVLASQIATGFSGGRLADYMKRYLGGVQRVRAGDSGSWGGWSTLLASLEWRRTLIEKRIILGHYDVGLGGVLFVDGGLVWPEVFGDVPLAAGGAGVGLRLFAPFVEVARVDVAWSPTHGAQVRIGRGHAF